MKKNNINAFTKKIMQIFRAHLENQNKLDRQAGATLIEVMVAVAIIVILMSAIGIAVVSNIDKANIAMALQNINTMKMGIKSYQLDPEHLGKMPEELSEIAPYLDPPQIPKDPWKNDYNYEVNEDGVTYKIYSSGKDGEKGTEDDVPKAEDETEETENP